MEVSGLVLNLLCGLEGDRTLNLLLRRQTLYPLSYEPEGQADPDRQHTRLLHLANKV